MELLMCNKDYKFKKIKYHIIKNYWITLIGITNILITLIGITNILVTPIYQFMQLIQILYFILLLKSRIVYAYYYRIHKVSIIQFRSSKKSSYNKLIVI